MAHNIPKLAELIAQNDQNLDGAYVTDLLQDAPFLSALYAKEASNGTNHEYLKSTGAPTVGFREIGVGRDHSKTARVKVTAELKLLDASFHLDAAFAEKHKNGIEGAMDAEGVEHVKAAFATGESQLIYGIGADATGYTGLADATTISTLAQPMVINAGGAQADGLSSVYFVRTGDTEAALVAGMDAAGNMLSVGEYNKQFVPDENGKLYPAYISDIHAWICMQVGSAHSLGRIANVGVIAGGPSALSDALISQAIAAFPSTRKPNMMVMSGKAQAQLQQSRTATNATGTEAPFPVEAFGVPIIVSDSVRDSETEVV